MFSPRCLGHITQLAHTTPVWSNTKSLFSVARHRGIQSQGATIACHEDDVDATVAPEDMLTALAAALVFLSPALRARVGSRPCDTRKR